MAADRPGQYIHATALLIGEAGVLIRGASGSGKSTLALQLIAEARPRGLSSSLVGDDRVRLETAHGVAVARVHPAIAGLIECRGLGLLSRPYAPACVIKLVVDLAPSEAGRTPASLDSVLLAGEIRVASLALDVRSAAQNCHIVFDKLTLLHRNAVG